MYSTEALAAKYRQIVKLSMEAERTARACRTDPTLELYELLDEACLDACNRGSAIELARWVGAKVAKSASREGALRALANEWLRIRALRRSAAISPKAARQVRDWEDRLWARADGLSLRAYRAREVRRSEAAALSRDRAAIGAMLAGIIARRGNCYSRLA